jgi:2'-5' RNA ligase
MHGVVSLLDHKHYQLTEKLWHELEGGLGLRGVYITPFPHFSYQVAQGYDVATLEPILQRTARKAKEFKVKTSGLGIFTGKPPVLYIPVVRTQALSQFHHALWNELSYSGSGIVEYYHPDTWMPHITIAFGDIHTGNLPQAIRLLSERSFNWEIAVNNISFIEDTGHGQELRFQFNFRS